MAFITSNKVDAEIQSLQGGHLLQYKKKKQIMKHSS